MARNFTPDSYHRSALIPDTIIHNAIFQALIHPQSNPMQDAVHTGHNIANIPLQSWYGTVGKSDNTRRKEA